MRLLQLLLVLLGALMVGVAAAVAPLLSRVKRTGLRQYGALAQNYVRAFDSKWLPGGAPADERLIGSSDIQSLADLASSYSVVQQMRLTPLSRIALLQFAGVILAPIAPLALTIMPAEKLIRRLAGMVV